jgi:hypothetical protein
MPSDHFPSRSITAQLPSEFHGDTARTYPGDIINGLGTALTDTYLAIEGLSTLEGWKNLGRGIGHMLQVAEGFAVNSAPMPMKLNTSKAYAEADSSLTNWLNVKAPSYNSHDWVEFASETVVKLLLAKGGGKLIGMTKIPVYRVYGGTSSVAGGYYSPIINPKWFAKGTYAKYAGLPYDNTARFLLSGQIKLNDLKWGTFGLAKSWPINLKGAARRGGLLEMQVDFKKVLNKKIEIYKP